MWTCVNFIIFFSLSSHVNGPIKWSYSHTRDYQNGHTKAQRTTRTEIRTNLSFLVAQKRNRKKLFGCKMSNLATEKTKNGCFRLQFQLKLISATELIFFGFTEFYQVILHFLRLTVINSHSTELWLVDNSWSKYILF